MNSYYPLALLVARQEAAQSALETAHSALPGAPVVVERQRPHSLRWAALRGHVATFLHRLAWAIEPGEHGTPNSGS